MIKPQFGFVVGYVPDIQAAKRFYIDVFGLDVERDHPTLVQFSHFAIANERADVTLRLTQRPYGKVFGIAEPSGTLRYLLELARERPSRPV